MQKSAPPLCIKVQQSTYLLIFIVAIHSLAILSSIAITLSLAIKLLLIALLVSSFYWQIQGYRHGVYTTTLKYTDVFAWQQRTQQQFTTIQILNSSVITSFIIILHVIADNQRRTILIFRDTLPNEIYRQLRVTLKINAQNAEP